MPHPDVVPFVSPHMTMSPTPGGALRVETPEAVLTYAPEDAGDVAAWLGAARALASPVPRPGRDPGDGGRFGALMAPAFEAGAVWDVSPLVDATDSEDQLSAYFALCDAWAHDIFVGPFWSTVLGGHADTALMLRWCEQFYHRTVGADEHNQLAVDHCQIPGVTEALLCHFSEEQGHGEIFLRGLEAAGVSRRAVASRPPLPSTVALLDFFGGLARSDTLAYLACYGVLHSPREGQTLEAVRRQFAWLAETYPEAAPAIRRIGEHAEIDVHAGHDQIVFEEHLLTRPPLSPGELARVLAAVSGTVTTFQTFFDGILQARPVDGSGAAA